MASKDVLKQVFEVESTHSAFYTGGQVEWTTDGSTLYCQCGPSIQVLDVATGRVTATISKAQKGEEMETIYTFALNSNDQTIITYHKSGLLKLWDTNTGKRIDEFRSVHDGPVSRLALRDMMFASGGIDSRVRLWDLETRKCTRCLKGLSGVVSVLVFRPGVEGEPDSVFAAAADTVIRSWRVDTGCKLGAFTGHFSQVNAIVFARDGKHMVSASRDRVLILWDLDKKEPVRTVPTFECLEGLVLLPPSFRLPGVDAEITGGINVASAGENGVIRVWEMGGVRELYAQQNSAISKCGTDGGLAVTRLLFNEATGLLAAVAADHNIMLHRLETFHCEKQLVGFTDDILDMALLGPDESHLALATNSSDVKMYTLADLGCRLLRGHTDIVIALAAAPADPLLLLSSSKDNTVRLWLLDPATGHASCLGVGARHTDSVGSVAFACGSAARFASVAQDSCLKLWTVAAAAAAGEEERELRATHTAVAHKMDINAVAFSPNDKLVATASQDKTVKLWSGDSLRPLGRLTGHIRSVWSVAFSPFQQELFSASADCTIRVWSLTSLTCLKSLQSHESAVLCVAPLTGGRQLLSAGADGLVKVWDVLEEKVLVSLHKHDARIWTLVVSRDESRFLTGGSDSRLVQWKDVTVVTRQETNEKALLLLEQEQELSNLMAANLPLKALRLALTLERPLQVLRIVKQVLRSGDDDALRACVTGLRKDQKQTLLSTAIVWNTNARNVYVAQLVLSMLMDDLAVGVLKVVPKTVEDGMPYTERHFSRLTRLLQDVHLLEYTALVAQPNLAPVDGLEAIDAIG